MKDSKTLCGFFGAVLTAGAAGCAGAQPYQGVLSVAEVRCANAALEVLVQPGLDLNDLEVLISRRSGDILVHVRPRPTLKDGGVLNGGGGTFTCGLDGKIKGAQFQK